MIDSDYVQIAARYNAWQNMQLRTAFEHLTDRELRAERGGFFGSLFRTANHLLWGDTLWVSRFDGGPGPAVPASEHDAITLNPTVWAEERRKMDRRILDWAQNLGPSDLEGNLTWVSASVGKEATKPRAVCVTHFFNHQTHHRGQLHAMLTSAGAVAPVTDLILMPDDGSFL